MSNDMFKGFEEFGAPQQVQNMVTVQYGLSVDTVKIVGEASAEANGMDPVGLAESLAAKFNMPTSGLRIFVDGKKLDFRRDTVIPTTARVIEFRQPSSEKGNGPVVLPLEDDKTVVIRIMRQDTTHYIRVREDERGKLSKSLRELVNLGGLEVLSEGTEYLHVGYRIPEVKVERRSLRLEKEMRRFAGGDVPGTGKSIDVIFINNIVSGEYPLLVNLNGENLADGQCQELQAGDVLTVILSGAIMKLPFEQWAVQQREEAGWAYYAAGLTRNANIEERTTELMAMNWAQLRILGVRLGIKVAGKGRTGDAVRADILLVEFPELPREEEFVRGWLAENAPEVLEG